MDGWMDGYVSGRMDGSHFFLDKIYRWEQNLEVKVSSFPWSPEAGGQAERIQFTSLALTISGNVMTVHLDVPVPVLGVTFDFSFLVSHHSFAKRFCAYLHFVLLELGFELRAYLQSRHSTT
jgi:hypothetical protein